MYKIVKAKISDIKEVLAFHMAFKVSYLLGKNWCYKTVKHLWDGDKYTEHIITKKE